jgi:hypothetical protein
MMPPMPSNRESLGSSFDDDDRDDEESSVTMGKSFQVRFLLDPESNREHYYLGRLASKDEGRNEDIQYAQVPRSLPHAQSGLAQMPALVPPSFDPIKGTKRSLLISAN